jgi:sugar/nucleoside kinase (ribokinase family)
VAGNVTEDRTPDGAWAPGGPSLYTARMAASLGAQVALITTLSPAYDRSALAGIELHVQPCDLSPRYANAYTPNGDRTQLLLAPGDTLELDGPLASLGSADALILAPAYHEFERPPVTEIPLVAVSLQGPLRTTNARGEVLPAPNPPRIADRFVRAGWFAFFSEEDTPDGEGLAKHVSESGATAVLTRGFRGATLFAPGSKPVHWDAIPANPTDPTGAGDCFSTAFIVRLAETGDIAAATAFALAAGSLAVEAPGLAGIPARPEIEARLAREAA